MHHISTHSCMSEIAGGHVELFAFIHNPLTLPCVAAARPSVLITRTWVPRDALSGQPAGNEALVLVGHVGALFSRQISPTACSAAANSGHRLAGFY